MKERPILFSGPMVRAIMDGRKTQTRRVVKNLAFPGLVDAILPADPKGLWCFQDTTPLVCIDCPYGDVGDRLWVRESYGIVPFPSEEPHPRLRIGPDGTGITWAADWFGNPSGYKWRPSIHMPRWASRITLEITAVRGERLNAISFDDAINEGWHSSCGHGPDYWFAQLWESINGQGSWATNPLVWVVSFKRIEN